jgi:hypothetical protein
MLFIYFKCLFKKIEIETISKIMDDTYIYIYIFINVPAMACKPPENIPPVTALIRAIPNDDDDETTIGNAEFCRVNKCDLSRC